MRVRLAIEGGEHAPDHAPVDGADNVGELLGGLPEGALLGDDLELFPVGLGVGGGTAGLTQNGNTSKRETAPSASFRVGYDMTSMLSLASSRRSWVQRSGKLTTGFL